MQVSGSQRSSLSGCEIVETITPVNMNDAVELSRVEEFWSAAGLSENQFILGPAGDVDVAPLLGWRNVIEGPPASGDCVIAIVGNAPYATISDLVAELGSYPVGVDICLLVTGDIDVFCDIKNLRRVARCGVEVKQAAGLAHPDLRLGVVLQRAKSRNSMTGEQMREQILIDAFSGIYRALRISEDANSDLYRTLGANETVQRLKQERAQTERQLEITRSRMHALSARLDHVERSATWRVGALITQAGRDPRQILKVFGGALGIWRGRRNRARGSAPTASASISLNGDQILGNFVLHGLANETVVGLIGSQPELGLLAERFAVVALAPHDAVAKIETARPEFLVISTDASSPDCVWCYLGSPNAIDKENTALAAIERARALQIPTILIRKRNQGDWRSLETASEVVVESNDASLLADVTKAMQRVRVNV